MARELKDIQTSLEGTIGEAITSPSTSAFAEWKLWSAIFAKAIWIFEGIMDAFKEQIQETITAKQPGTFEWYYEKILEFQGTTDELGTCQGDNLVVKNGLLEYETVDETRRIVTKASLSAASSVLSVKAAKDSTTPGDFQELTASEKLAFGLYLDNIKYPGTEITVISLAPDKIKYSLQIVYDPAYTTTTIQANVEAALLTYRASLGFAARVYPAKIVEAITKCTGVVSVKINLIQGWSVTSGVFDDIDLTYDLVAGYFNWDVASVMTFTNYKTI